MTESTPPLSFSLVIIESPFSGKDELQRYEHIRYARAALLDCLRRGEAPFASHLLYTQLGVLKDSVPGDRSLSIEAGLAWGAVAERTVVYQDLGISEGMQKGIDRARACLRPVEFRELKGWQ